MILSGKQQAALYYARKRRRLWWPVDALAAYRLRDGRYMLRLADATYAEALDESGSPRVYLVPDGTYDVTFSFTDAADDTREGEEASAGNGYTEPNDLASASIDRVIFREAA
jgi:hypothetical protein